MAFKAIYLLGFYYLHIIMEDLMVRQASAATNVRYVGMHCTYNILLDEIVQFR